MQNQKESEGSLERLERTLYSRDEKLVPKDERGVIERDERDVPRDWGAPKSFAITADEMKKKGSGLRIPTKVKEDTEKYRKDSDKYYEYINKNAIKGDPDDKLDFKTFYDGFKGWYRGCYHDKPPTIQEFTDYLNRENYKVIGNFILGYKLMPEGCAEPEEDELA